MDAIKQKRKYNVLNESVSKTPQAKKQKLKKQQLHSSLFRSESETKTYYLNDSQYSQNLHASESLYECNEILNTATDSEHYAVPNKNNCAASNEKTWSGGTTPHSKFSIC